MSQEGLKPVIDLQNANIAQVGEKPSTDLHCNKGVNVNLDIYVAFQELQILIEHRMLCLLNSIN
jgi:hypothetical protein